jgi:hypothetical protein
MASMAISRTIDARKRSGIPGDEPRRALGETRFLRWSGLVGFVHPVLYSVAGDTREITKSNNGEFSAVAGWDAFTGPGSQSARTADLP